MPNSTANEKRVANAIRSKGENVIFAGRPVKALVAKELTRYDSEQETSVEGRWILRLPHDETFRANAGDKCVFRGLSTEVVLVEFPGDGTTRLRVEEK